MAAADASRAAQSRRSRVVARALLHSAHVLGLVVLLRAFGEFPWAAAAAPSIILRFAALLLTPQRICFLLANGIVIALGVLATFFPPDAASSSPTFAGDASDSPSPSSNSNGGDAVPEQHPLLKFLDASRTQQQVTEADPSGEVVFEDKEAVHVQTVRAAQPQPPRRTVSSEKTGGGGGAADKETVRVWTVRAQPPRRTVSDKTGGGVAAAGRTSTAAAAASPELRRAKSENGRRRQQRSAAAAAAPAELGTDDEEAFRLLVEAFIAKQQTLFREESLIGGRGEDGPTLAGGAAAVAVK